MANSSLELLKKIPCFAGLSPELMELMSGGVEKVTFAKGELILMEGEPCPGLFIVQSGSVKLYRSSLEGDEQIVRIVHRGGCFECAPLFDKGPNPVSAEALEPTELLLLPASHFEALMTSNPQAVLQIVPMLAMRLRSMLNMIDDFSFRRVSCRLARLLLQLSEKESEALVVSPHLPLNQQHLACMLGCSRQLTNTSLRKLVESGVIEMKGRRIIVLNAEALRKLAYPGV
ncbi:MAG: Crp/Fnr family transcriptional regulator [Chloroflexi bacterium]|nr:Crp/Fnr family transcriptional regulator [Chloroflexota bacterium]